MKGSGRASNNIDIGRIGENIAAEFLASRKYSIVERNFRTPFGELDIIAEKEGRTVFVEVKTRVSERFGPPLSAIGRSKQNTLLKNCMFYIKIKGLFGKSCRIDAIGIYLDNDKRSRILQHVKNAVQLIERRYTC